MNRAPFNSIVVDTNDKLSRNWVVWISEIQRLQTPDHGTTANRPISNLEIGQFYFDDTLGKPIWLKSVGPDVWVDGVGTVS